MPAPVSATGPSLEAMPSDLSRELSNATIEATVGSRSMVAGLSYAHSGRVLEVSDDGQGRLLYAQVQGTRATPYVVVVSRAASAGGRWSGSCTCPVAFDCKHVAAAMIAAREQQIAGRAVVPPAPRALWESALGELVSSGTSVAAASHERFALQIELVDDLSVWRFGQGRGGAPGGFHGSPGSGSGGSGGGDAWAPPQRLRLRPVRMGRRGSWVRTGASWSDISRQGGYAGLTSSGPGAARISRQLEVLRSMLATYQARARGYYGYGDVAVHLDDLGASAWSLLGQAVAAGLELVLAGTGAAVALAPEPGRVVLDLTRAPDGSARLVPVVMLGDQPLPRSALSLVGEPAHGLAVRGGDAVAEVAVLLPAYDAGSGLVLVGFSAALDPHVDRLLRSPRGLEIPAGDLARFVRGYLPGVRRVVEVTSSDAFVELPEALVPEVALTVTFGPEHDIDLEWGFAYGGPSSDDGAATVVPFDGEADVLRDHDAERDLLDRLDGATRTLLGRDQTPRRRLTGMDAVAFTRDVLPQLRLVPGEGPAAGSGAGGSGSAAGRPRLRVVGDEPEFRESVEAPVIHLSTTDRAGAADGVADWFDLGVTVTVEGEEVPFDRLFRALADEHSHLVLTSGTYLALDRPELLALRRLIEEARSLQDRPSNSADSLRVNVYQAALWDELVTLGVVEAQSARWSQVVQGLLDVERAAPPPVPVGFDAELRPYQLDGFRWLAFLWEHGLGGVLADDMGLGKTIQALALVCHARERGQLPGPFLVVAPTSVVGNWVAEARRFAPGLKVAGVTETQAKRATPLLEDVAGMDLVVTSYTLFRIDTEAYQGLPWAGLVLDEAQVVKNHQAKTYQCARRLAAPFKLAVTGTPLENSLMDLWSLLSIVAPGLFPNPVRFGELYRKPIERGDAPELLATLRRRVRPLMLRRTKDQVVADLPPKQEQVLDVVLHPRHQKVYQTHLQRERAKVLKLLDDLDGNRFEIFRSLTLLRRLSLAPSLVDPAYAAVPATKVDALLEQLEEVVAEGHRVLVFSQFTSFLGVVRERLDSTGIGHAYLDGSTRRRAVVIDGWKASELPVFLISLKAGGVGLNLTEADYVFILDPWWNPAVEAQAVDRTHRIGQDKPVMVYRLVSVGTIEEKVMELKARKQDLFARVMDGGGLEAAPLSAADIRGLFD